MGEQKPIHWFNQLPNDEDKLLFIVLFGILPSYALPKLSTSSCEIVSLDGVAQEVMQNFKEILTEININIQSIPNRSDLDFILGGNGYENLRQNWQQKGINDTIQVIPKVTLGNHAVNYQWSTTLKHADTKIIWNQVKSETGCEQMILFEPSFSITDVTKVTLKITKLIDLMLSLSDVNIAKNIRPTWDYRHNVGEGCYSHYSNGGIYPHHLATNQTLGQVLAFTFKEGDVLELEWNGPLKQFTTSRLSTKEKQFQIYE